MGPLLGCNFFMAQKKEERGKKALNLPPYSV